MRTCARITLVVLLTIASCNAKQTPGQLSYEDKLKRGEAALRGGKILEAGKWAQEALTIKPEHLEAQKLMAKVYDRQIAETKTLSRAKVPEELKSNEKSLQVKTLLERSRTLLDMNLLKEANDTAEEALQLDPDHLEASRLLDAIKEKAQKQGREESLFLQNLYDEEVASRVERYTQQAQQSVKEKRWGAARLTVEKILLLDPRNSAAKKLLSEIEKHDEDSLAAVLREPLDKE